MISFCVPSTVTVNERLLRLTAANTQLHYFTLNVNSELSYATQSVKEDNSHPIIDLYKSSFLFTAHVISVFKRTRQVGGWGRGGGRGE